MIRSTLVAIAFTSVARAQIASLYPIGFLDGPWAGTPIGTGAEGTTYEILGTFSDSDINVIVTMTLVEDATHVADEAVIAGDSNNKAFTFYASCGLGSTDAVCTEIDANEVATLTVTYSGPYELIDVPIGTDTALGTTTTALGSTATVTVSVTPGASSEPVLPPSIPVRNTQPTATITSMGSSAPAPAPSSTSAPDTGSGAVKNAFVGLAMGVIGPAVLALLLTLRI